MLLGRYRFTAREDRSTWSEAAIDPEMLGKAFESLMQPRERHSSGAYYTRSDPGRPRNARGFGRGSHVACRYASDVAALLGGESPAACAVPALRDRVRQLRILDPACGSGAFLVYALESLATLLGRLGDSRGIAECRRAVLTRSIFGVDVNPTAVWLCELRLWLSVVIESGESDEPARARSAHAPCPTSIATCTSAIRSLAAGSNSLAGGRDGRRLDRPTNRWAS